jgi:hypothetical protein
MSHLRHGVIGAAGLALLSAALVSAQRGDGLQLQADGTKARFALDKPPRSAPIVGRAVAFAVSRPVTELPEETAPNRDAIHDVATGLSELPAVAAEGVADGALQRVSPTPNMPSPIAGFDGLNNQDNQTAFGFMVSPPDANGQAGPSHFVQAVNLLVRVYNKVGTPLTAPFKMSSLFAPIGGICSTNDEGNPIVLHDQLANRWLISQPTVTAPSHQCIAISTTGDPTGSYFLYDYVLPGTNIDAHPKFGMWPDGYYMSNHQFNATVTLYLGQGVFAFDRSKMLVGDPGAAFIYFNRDASHFGMLPSDMDGQTTPPLGTPNYFAMLGTSTTLRIFGFHAEP